MDKFRVQGPTKLQDEATVSGARNATLSILFAALLAEGPVKIQNVPKLKGVDTSMKLLSQLGTKVEHNGSVHIDARGVNIFYAPYDLVKTIRASIWALGSLVARFGQGRVSLSGSYTIDACPVNLHISSLEQLGATIELEEGYVKASIDGRLKGAHIVMDKASVGATVTVIYATVLAKGTTIIENAAREPEVVDTVNLLITPGAKISGQGTDRIVIEGVEHLGGGVYHVLPGRIETDTFLVAAAISRGKIIYHNTRPDTLDAVLAKLRDAGADIEVGEDRISLNMHDKRPKAVNVHTALRPTFSTDMQVQFTLLNLVAEGTGFVTETVFEDRFIRIPELSRMDVHAKTESNAVICHGVGKLSGAQVMATDLRALTSLVLAGCITERTMVVDHIYHIDCGYKHIKDRLRALGTNTERVKGE